MKRCAPGLVLATCDGDTPMHARQAVQREAHVVLTNPDLLGTPLALTPCHWECGRDISGGGSKGGREGGSAGGGGCCGEGVLEGVQEIL